MIEIQFIVIAVWLGLVYITLFVGRWRRRKVWPWLVIPQFITYLLAGLAIIELGYQTERANDWVLLLLVSSFFPIFMMLIALAWFLIRKSTPLLTEPTERFKQTIGLGHGYIFYGFSANALAYLVGHPAWVGLMFRVASIAFLILGAIREEQGFRLALSEGDRHRIT